MALKTRAQVLAEFDRCGESVSNWAAQHGIPRNTVSGLLQGRLKGRRGHAHKAAVLLRLKEGVVDGRVVEIVALTPEAKNEGE
ncbi:DNA-binding protein [Paraburkholderia sp. NMBU_R16]|nr:DNA-binding protein [Paraburkholderia sp. NMBU_R16]NRO99329.1 DNA-binding protein [Paraburkholderia sp. NMBU_R16]